MESYKIPDFIIIDDNPVNNVLCKKVIRLAYPEADITIFSQAGDALDYLRSFERTSSRGIIFLDINMPVISGWDFIKAFDKLDMKIKEQIRVYILSSSIDPLDKIRSASNKNIWNYISKPLTREAVNNTVNKLLEEDAAAFAREIHDVLGQQLMKIKMDTSWLSSKIENPGQIVQERIAEALKLVDDTVQTVRGIIKGLRPQILDDLGLFAALEWQASEFSRYTGIPCTLSIEMNEPEYSKMFSGNVFRIFQETLTNIGKHAEATEVTASIKYHQGNMILSVMDNGKGFDTSRKKRESYGITGLRERAAVINGSLDIKSAANKGTTVELTVPVII